MSVIAVLTSGGDSPGMNAVLYSILVSAKLDNSTVLFVENGYDGLIKNQFKSVDLFCLQKSICNAGSVIGSARSLEFKDNKESRVLAVQNLKKNDIDVLVVVGGNGSYKGAELISKLSFPVIGIPATIDNDVGSSSYTVGFFSALEEIHHAIRKIRCTSDSHNQVTLLEVMGRDCSDLSVFASVAGAVDLVVTNQNPKTCKELVEVIREIRQNGKKGIVIVVSEKIYGSDFGFNLPPLTEVAIQLEKQLDLQVRVNVLGYLQRGAYPTAWELYVANGFGKYTYEQIRSKNLNIAIGFDGSGFYHTNIEEANNIDTLPRNSDIAYHNKLFKVIKQNG